MILDKYSYLDTQLNFSGTNTFLPNYSFGNELFYNPNSNTFSAGVKYNSYNSSSSTLLILGWRYDFEPVYMGIKETLTLAETTPGYATKVYVGVKSQRHRTELGYTTGTSVEDSAVTKQVYFHQVDGSFNYRINLLTEIGFRISDYQSDSLNQRGYYLNILFKY